MSTSSNSYLRGANDQLVNHIGEMFPFNQNIAVKGRNLIIVAGHAILRDGDLHGVETMDSKWHLLDYQQRIAMPESILNHIKLGVELAIKDPSALLIFSGGQTRADAGPKSEAESYFQVADHMEWFSQQGKELVRHRTILEEYALDSFQNLLFSVCRFREITGAYPATITVVSFSYKKQRFKTLHRAAIRFPESSFHFESLDPEKSSFLEKLPDLVTWESRASAVPFKTDPYGCNSAVLKKKRVDRDVYFRKPPYQMTCPEITPLLTYWYVKRCSTQTQE